MAPVLKKARRPIGSMDETIVPETPNQANDGDSEDDSMNSDSHISPSGESDHDETQNNDEATNDQGKYIIKIWVFFITCYTLSDYVFK